MSVKRTFADFFIRGCGLRHLHDTRLQRGIRTVLDEIDLQHLRDASSCPAFSDRVGMFEYILSNIIGNEPIDYLEFGVYRGESIKQWISNTNGNSRFFGFDSFEGLPENWRKGQDKGHFSVNGQLPDIRDARVTFVPGWFDKTVPEFARSFIPKNRLVVHFDADLYGSTILPMVYLQPSLAKGSLLLFDEFYDRDHEFKAFRDFLKIGSRDYRLVCQAENFGKVCIELL
ncbi:MAG TPA: TylF/MycF/NovP-related O-methyltransferase [Chthoniobacterales bacterium]|jgi:hypothetical protein